MLRVRLRLSIISDLQHDRHLVPIAIVVGRIGTSDASVFRRNCLHHAIDLPLLDGVVDLSYRTQSYTPDTPFGKISIGSVCREHQG